MIRSCKISTNKRVARSSAIAELLVTSNVQCVHLAAGRRIQDGNATDNGVISETLRQFAVYLSIFHFTLSTESVADETKCSHCTSGNKEKSLSWHSQLQLDKF